MFVVPVVTNMEENKQTNRNGMSERIRTLKMKHQTNMQLSNRRTVPKKSLKVAKINMDKKETEGLSFSFLLYLVSKHSRSHSTKKQHCNFHTDDVLFSLFLFFR